MLLLTIKHFSKQNLALLVILLVSLFIRVYNLNFNTPFNDEAIYIVIGNLGIIENDFYTYTASNWMGGLPIMYPVFSALVYQTGGIVASRLLNVIFGVLLIEEVYVFTKRLNLFDEKTNKTASLISALIVGISGLGIYTSRLATYDMPSFFFLVFGINNLIRAGDGKNGKYYFIAAVSLLIAFFTKIVVGVYYPLIVLGSFYFTKKYQDKKLNYWLKYFLFTLLIGFIVYLALNINSLLSFFTGQVSNEAVPVSRLLFLIREDIGLVLVMALVSSAVFLIKRNIVIWGSLSFAAIILPLIHLAIQRYTTFDKHLYLTVIFLAPIIGYGISSLYRRGGFYYRVIQFTMIIVGLIFVVDSYRTQIRLENSWPNTTTIDNYLLTTVTPEDRILTQAGASTILALYQKTHPTNVTTFDWINYSGYQDEKGYIQAVQDKYFKYIELTNNPENSSQLASLIYEQLPGRYNLIFTDKEFEIYERL